MASSASSNIGLRLLLEAAAKGAILQATSMLLIFEKIHVYSVKAGNSLRAAKAEQKCAAQQERSFDVRANAACVERRSEAE